MLLLMIERGMPIDAVLTADTGMEFPEMYEHLDRLDEYLYRERGIHLTTLRHPKGFEWLMFEEPKQKLSSMHNFSVLHSCLPLVRKYMSFSFLILGNSNSYVFQGKIPLADQSPFQDSSCDT